MKFYERKHERYFRKVFLWLLLSIFSKVEADPSCPCKSLLLFDLIGMWPLNLHLCLHTALNKSIILAIIMHAEKKNHGIHGTSKYLGLNHAGVLNMLKIVLKIMASPHASFFFNIVSRRCSNLYCCVTWVTLALSIELHRCTVLSVYPIAVTKGAK